MANLAADPAPWPVRRDLKLLFTLAWPVVVSRLGIMTMGLSDTVAVGHFSPQQLGWQALAWSITSVVLGVSLNLMGGVQVMTSRAMGEGRPREAGAVLRRGLSYAVMIGGLAAVAQFAFGPALLRAFRLPADLTAGAERPIQILAISMPFFVMGAAASSWLEGLGRTRIPAIFMWVANGINLLALFLLVPGTFGLPAMGAVGAAWATLAARGFLTLGLLVFILLMPEARDLGVFEPAPRDRAAETEQRRVGYGAGASGFFEIAAFAGMNIIAGWLGGVSVGVWAIVVNVVSVAFMVPLGLSTAASVLVGRAYGAGDFTEVRRASLLAYGLAALFGGLIALLVWPGAKLVASAYTIDPATLALAVPAMALASAMVLPDAIQVVVAQTLRARGDVWMPTATHFLSYVLVMAPLSWWLAIPAGLGVNGIVLGVILASLLSAGLLLARFAWLWRRAG